MDKEIIFNFIHSPQNMMALGILIDKRVDELKERLVHASSDQIQGLQSSISELRRFKNIKEIITKEVKNG